MEKGLNSRYRLVGSQTNIKELLNCQVRKRYGIIRCMSLEYRLRKKVRWGRGEKGERRGGQG